MPSKLVELRDQLIIDAGIEGDPKFPIPRLNRLIVLAERYVQTQLIPLGLKKFEKSLLVTISGGTYDGLVISGQKFNSASDNVATISIPFTDGAVTGLGDLLENPSSILFLDCQYKLASATSYGIAYEVDKDRFKEVLQNSFYIPTKQQPVFMRLNNKIWIAPLTDVASSYVVNEITVFYHKVITDISVVISPATDADQNTTEIPAEFEEHVIRKAKIEVDTILEKIQNKNIAIQRLQKELVNAYAKFAGGKVEMNRANTQTLKSKLQ